MRSVARVLYEDQAKQVKDFGPHTLVLACVADDLGQSRWDLKHIVPGIPRKGDNKLLRSCREEAGDWCADGSVLVAVFDNDRVRPLLGLPQEACRRIVLNTILSGSTAAGSVKIVLLEQNVDDLVRASAAALAETPPARKSINARDTVLNRAAAADSAIRQKIRTGSPSFDRIVRYVADIVR